MSKYKPGYAQVAQFDDFTLGQENILCFQVTMQNVSLVHVLKKRQHKLVRKEQT